MAGRGSLIPANRILPVLFAAFIVVAVLAPVAAWAAFYPITASNDNTAPPAPAFVSVSTPEEGKLGITWGSVTDPLPNTGISGYIIYRSAQAITDANKKSVTAAVEIVALPGDTTTYVDAGVVRGDIYYYAIAAENGAGLEGAIATAAVSAPVTGTNLNNLFPHQGSTYSADENVCRNCHKIHRSPAGSRVFRKTNTSGGGSEETCFACHDGTGSQYDIKQSFPAAGHFTVLTTPNTIDIRCVHCHNPHKATQVVGDNPFMTRRLEESLCLGCHKDGHSRNGWSIDRQFSAAYSMSWHSILSSATADNLPGAKIECSNCHGPHTAQAGDSSPGTNPANNGSEFLSRLSYPFNTYLTWGSQVGGIDETRETPANFVDFCLNCHRPAPWPEQTFGASVFVPYSIAFPNMDPVTYPFFWGWDKTHFRDQNPPAAHYDKGLACRNCHHPHGSSNPRLNAYFDPPLGSDNTTNNYDASSTGAREERLCLRCHQATRPNGFSTAPNILSDLANDASNNSINGTWYTMPIRDSSLELRHKDTEDYNAFGPPGVSGLPNRHVECVDCHDPHKAKAGKPPAGNDISPANFGVAGVSVTNGTQGTTPTYTVTLSPTKEYELCFKCHSAWAYGSVRPASTVYNTGLQADKSIEFNPNNSSYHPIEAPGKNVSQNLADQLLGGLSTGSTLRCSDCHTSNNLSGVQGQAINYTGTGRGPHGSTQQSIRRGTYWNDPVNLPPDGTFNASRFTLCGGCHNLTALTARRWGDGARTNFYDDINGKDNLHWVHLDNRIRATCKNCHYNVHSNVQATSYANNTQWNVDGVIYGDQAGEMPPPNIDTHLINFSPEITPFGGRAQPEWVYNSSTRQRNCNLQCHGGTMDNFPYRPANGGDQPPGQ